MAIVCCTGSSGLGDGTHGVVLDPLDFIARLVVMIPVHLLRYYRVLAPHANARREVVLGPTPGPASRRSRRWLFDGETTELANERDAIARVLTASRSGPPP